MMMRMVIEMVMMCDDHDGRVIMMKILTINDKNNDNDDDDVTELLRDGSKGNLSDRARLLALAIIVGLEGTDSTGNNDFEAAFRAGCAAMASPAIDADMENV